MRKLQRFFLGLLFLLISSAFSSITIKSQTEFPKTYFVNVPNYINEPDSDLVLKSPYNHTDFERAVMEEAAKILGWHYERYDSIVGMISQVNPLTGEELEPEERGMDPKLSVTLNVKNIDGIEFYSPITPSGNGDQYTTFHGYPATYGKLFQDWETTLLWDMEGYRFSAYVTYGTDGYGIPDAYPYGEALYKAFWNVTNGTTDNSAAPPVPQSPPSDPDNLPADLCAGVNCKNNYCKADGSKFLYDCTCDPEDGKCYCSGIDCPAGCDDALGGCVMQASGDPNEEDLCADVQCEPDYCLDDQKTRMHDCKCDPAYGECYCYSEICQAGCNMATGRCVESMVIDESGSSGATQYPYPDDSPDLLGILGVVGGGGLAIGGGYLGIKALQGALARRSAKAIDKSAAEPTLRELLSQAEKSADRASQAIDQAQKAGQSDQQGYKEFLKRRTGYDEQWAQHMHDRAALIEKAEYAVTKIKKGTDVAADLLGNVPGAGDTFKAIYDYSTTAAESIASGESTGEVILKTTSKFVENKVSGKLFGNLTTMEWLPTRIYKRSLKVACRQIGAKNLIVESTKNELTNSAMNSLKKIKSKTSFGKIEKRVEAVAKRADRKGISKMIKKVLYRK